MLRFLRYGVGLLLCAPALLLPYRARVVYGNAVAWLFHLPYIVFGRVARTLLRKLNLPLPPHGS